MNILVTNDDGINSPGIIKLANVASKFGNVTVVAPSIQCSAMSQKLTIFDNIHIHNSDSIADNIKAFSIDGTPTDCVKIAMQIIMETKPDIVFSGINNGYNIGYDIAYSGTIGACFEALQFGIPAIAFSKDFGDDFSSVDPFIEGIVNELINTPISENELFNVNFPNCPANDVRGIIKDAVIAPVMYYKTLYSKELLPDGSYNLHPESQRADASSLNANTDISIISRKYISIGKVVNPVIFPN